MEVPLMWDLANRKAGHSLGLLNLALYGIGNTAGRYASDFHDVTVGNNQAYGTAAGLGAAAG